MKVRCKISKYDETITSPPYRTIAIDEMTVVKPQIDHHGENFAENLRRACICLGYNFKFYTMCYDKNYDYEVVVY